MVKIDKYEEYKKQTGCLNSPAQRQTSHKTVDSYKWFIRNKSTLRNPENAGKYD